MNKILKETLIDKSIYKGNFIDKNNLYMFFDISNLNIDNFYISTNDTIWFLTYDEIINHNKICNFNIDMEVVDFFNENSYFLNIRNTLTNEIYDYPIVVYTGNIIQKTKFQSIFGNVRSEKSMGNYYYFTTYNEAVKNSLKVIESEIISGGIVRFCVFLKKIKHIINSDDYINKWYEKYDSLFINNLNFNLDNYPCWVIKNYEQQYPLSYHITKMNIDKRLHHFENNFENFYIV